MLRRPLRNPIWSLTIAYLLWKIVLFSIISASPGIGYDTSTDILFNLNPSDIPRKSLPEIKKSFVELQTIKLVRWDALYYSKISERGYLNEQEWAFSWGFTRLVSILTKYLMVDVEVLKLHIYVAATLANIAHFLSVLVLYYLSLLFGEGKDGPRFAFVTALLHVVSPAGVFLCAPYAESSFSLTNFLGTLLFAHYFCNKRNSEDIASVQNISLLLSGFFFGLATSIRSNGVLSGILFLVDLAMSILDFFRASRKLGHLVRIFICIFAGCLTGLGLLIPQFIAFSSYCIRHSADAPTRPWCNSWVPSIFSWVQSHYWNVGFLRYWTLSNVPLFLLAVPMIFTLAWSAKAAIELKTAILPEAKPGTFRSEKVISHSQGLSRNLRRDTRLTCLRLIAIPQLALAVLATTSFHVQIINRIASGYPLWYMVISSALLNEQTKKNKDWPIAPIALHWMIIYSVIQAGLYAGFLPPA